MARRMDRLSTLPDELIAHIFSSLPTEIAISNSILSSRFNSTTIYSSLTSLDFDNTFYEVESEDSEESGDSDDNAVQENQEEPDDLLQGNQEDVFADEDGAVVRENQEYVGQEESYDDDAIQEYQEESDDDDDAVQEYRESDDDDDAVQENVAQELQLDDVAIQEDEFVSFVDKVLSMNKLTCLKKLRLRFTVSRGRFVDSINRWIEDVVMKNVVEMDLRVAFDMHHGHCAFPFNDYVAIPPSDSLRILKFDLFFGKYRLSIPKMPKNFPNLRVLDLRIVLYDQDIPILSRLLFNLPQLEKMVLYICFQFKDIRSLDICIIGHGLRSLDVKLMGSCYDLTVLVDAPNLEYLRFYDDYNIGSRLLFQHLEACESVSNLGWLSKMNPGFRIGAVNHPPALRDVVIDVGDSDIFFNGYLDEDDRPVNNAYTDLMRMVHTTSSLSISLVTTLALIYNGDINLPVFKNLTKLEMDLLPNGGWGLLSQWLEKCPKLTVLVLVEKDFWPLDLVEENDWHEPNSVPRCLLLHLKRIEMRRLPRLAAGGFLIYILNNGKVLEKFSTESHEYDLDNGVVTSLLESLVNSGSSQI